MELKTWKMSYEEYTDLPCQAPCSMYSVLLEHGLIQDPFYGMNDKKYTALSEKDCSFVCDFTVSEETLTKEYVELYFYGLDTICHIILNGTELDCVQNMHRFYWYDVKPFLQSGENRLTLHFKSPIQFMTEQNNKFYLWNNNDTVKGVSHLRKAMSMSGWDWGPKLPDMGIFRKVELQAYNGDMIEDVNVLQFHKEDTVRLRFEVTIKHGSDAALFVHMDGKRIRLEHGMGEITIEHPKLWWVRGYGDQPLYDLEVWLEKNEKVLDRVHKRIGLRTLTVSTARDEHGAEFCFINNGVKIFAMGADYVPEDNLLSRVTTERLHRLLDACVDANFNCLRIWGGGYYPDDVFYDICDELGILVWQDFMTACYPVRLTERFKKEYTEEAVYNIKRLRSHASLGLWCGNNELEISLSRNPNLYGSQRLIMDYMELFEQILPDLCEQYAPQTFYWPSSPSSGGGFLHVENEQEGDWHYWDIWFNNIPFSDYRNHKIRFCSEYGFQSFPPMKTIRSFAEPEDWNCFSRVMEDHQKSSMGNRLLLTYLADHYLAPYSFENLVYATQLLQADAIRYGVEHFRSIRGICMGSLYWQFNDCWPVASWSSVDYYGRYKALHYAAKKFYAPVSFALFYEKGHLRVNLFNETTKSFHGTLKVKLCRNNFFVLEELSQPVSGSALSATDIFEVDIIPEDPYTNYLCAELYDGQGTLLLRQTELFAAPKHYAFCKPQIKITFEKLDKDLTLAKVSSNVFAKNVYLDFADFDCVFSDNFFDLTDDGTYEVSFRTDRSIEELDANLQVKTVYDIGLVP